MNKLQLNLQPPSRARLQTAPPQKTDNRRHYIIELLTYFGMPIPEGWQQNATPAPVFTEPDATPEMKVERIKVTKKG